MSPLPLGSWIELFLKAGHPIRRVEAYKKTNFDITLYYDAFVHGRLFVLPFVNATNLVALLVLYPVTAIGVTLGHHRMMSHKAFKAPKWLERTIMTSPLSVQGGPIEWVGYTTPPPLPDQNQTTTAVGKDCVSYGMMFYQVPQ